MKSLLTRMKSKSRITRVVLVCFILMALISVITIQPVSGQNIGGDFGETKVEFYFPKGIKFSAKLDVASSGSLYFMVRIGSDVWQEVDPNCATFFVDRDVDYFSCVYFLDMQNLPPQTSISYKWRFESGYINRPITSEEKTILYSDPGYTWHSLSTDYLTVWWHDHPQDFAERVQATAESAIQKQQLLFGLALEFPIQIVIENSQEEFLSWENDLPYTADGRAFPRQGVTVQVAELDFPEQWMTKWLNVIIPHEISHLYFFQASGRQQQSPPNWLNEGLARYNEFSTHNDNWILVGNAIIQGKLIPLTELRDIFNGTDERIQLSYAESMTAAEYLVSTYGQEGLNTLFSNYKNYKNNDEAFQAAFGKSVNEVEADWEVWVKKEAKVQFQQKPMGLPTLNQIKFFLITSAVVYGGSTFFLILWLLIYFRKRKPINPNGKGSN